MYSRWIRVAVVGLVCTVACSHSFIAEGIGTSKNIPHDFDLKADQSLVLLGAGEDVAVKEFAKKEDAPKFFGSQVKVGARDKVSPGLYHASFVNDSSCREEDVPFPRDKIIRRRALEHMDIDEALNALCTRVSRVLPFNIEAHALEIIVSHNGHGLNMRDGYRRSLRLYQRNARYLGGLNRGISGPFSGSDGLVGLRGARADFGKGVRSYVSLPPSLLKGFEGEHYSAKGKEGGQAGKDILAAPIELLGCFMLFVCGMVIFFISLSRGSFLGSLLGLSAYCYSIWYAF